MYNRLPEDRRRFPRLKVALAVNLELDGHSQVSDFPEGQPVEAETIDLGCGGIAINSRFNIPADTRLRLKLYLSKPDDPNVLPIEATGQVRSSVPLEGGLSRIGICFEEVDLHDSLKIHRFVNTALDN